MSAQPPMSAAYEESLNPVSKDPVEKSRSSHNENASGVAVPQERGEDPTPSSLATGVQGRREPVNEREARNTGHGSRTGENELQNDSENAEQMATLSEGKVADAVQRKSGTQRHGDKEPKFDDFASDLDRKKAEQAEAREEIKSARSGGHNVDGGVGAQRGGVEVD